MDSSSQSNAGARAGFPRLLSSPSAFIGLICGYFVLHVGLRLMTSGTADLDEAEQLVMTQQFAWGYGAQPPLYTWLQLPLVKVFGPTILALALLKGLLLIGIYAVTYRNARIVLRDHTQAMLATLSLLFIPQICWESQRDLTHSVLVTLAAVLTFHAFLRLVEKQGAVRYLMFGVAAATGLLAKYSFGVFLAGLLLAALSIRSLRHVVLSRRMCLALFACSLMVLPAICWAVQHREATLAATAKLTLGNRELSWGPAVLKGLLKLGTALVAHAGPLLGLYACVILSRARRFDAFGRRSEHAIVIWHGTIFMVALFALGILLTGASRFLDRWLMPLGVWLPILLVMQFHDQLDVVRQKILFAAALAVALIVSLAIPGRVRFAEVLNWPQSLSVPFDTLAAELQKHSSPSDLIVAENAWIAGNLRLQLPGRQVICPNVVLADFLQPGESCLVVWDETNDKGMTRQFADFCRNVLGGGYSRKDAHTMPVTMNFFSRKQAKFGWMESRVMSAPEHSKP